MLKVGVWGFGFGVWGKRIRVQGPGFRAGGPTMVSKRRRAGFKLQRWAVRSKSPKGWGFSGFRA